MYLNRKCMLSSSALLALLVTLSAHVLLFVLIRENYEPSIYRKRALWNEQGSSIDPQVIIPIKNRDDLPIMLEKIGLDGIGIEISSESRNYTNHILEEWKSSSKFILVESPDSCVKEVEECVKERKNFTEKWNDKIDVLFSTPKMAASEFNELEVDFVYINKSQDYCGLLEELKLWWSKIRVGGVMAGHDYLKDSALDNKNWNLCEDGTFSIGGVRNAVNEFAVQMGTVVSVTYGAIDDNDDTPTWYTQKMKRQTNSGSFTNYLKEVPTVYTYIDRSEPYVNEELIKVWMANWKYAGWNAEILTPDHAKQHPEFNLLNDMLHDANICCLPKQSFYRFLAMSTIPSGGFYSEPYVFPLLKEFSRIKNHFPTSGVFTSYDGKYHSLMSGSNEEWNRMTTLLIKNIDKNSIVTLRKIREQDPLLLHYENLVQSSSRVLEKEQFEFDICENDDKIAIRFHQSERGYGRYRDDDIPALVNSWIRLYKVRCMQKRPIMFTFYESVDYMESEDPFHLLQVWKELWSDAGFEPFVLTLEDAKRHPKYERYNVMLEGNGRQFRYGRDKYNFLCFLRWVAMAASGGGWMSDFDTFPLNIRPSLELPNNGQFTGHNWVVPNLLSGSAQEWDRLAALLFENFKERNSQIAGFWSDMYAANQVFQSQSAFLAQKYTREISGFYSQELTHNLNITNPYYLLNKCQLSESILAIHFSHSSCKAVKFCHIRSKNSTLRRSYIAEKWVTEWKKQCKEKNQL